MSEMSFLAERGGISRIALNLRTAYTERCKVRPGITNVASSLSGVFHAVALLRAKDTADFCLNVWVAAFTFSFCEVSKDVVQHIQSRCWKVSKLHSAQDTEVQLALWTLPLLIDQHSCFCCEARNSAKSSLASPLISYSSQPGPSSTTISSPLASTSFASHGVASFYSGTDPLSIEFAVRSSSILFTLAADIQFLRWHFSLPFGASCSTWPFFFRSRFPSLKQKRGRDLLDGVD